jgi:hypothetical protein
MSPRIALILLVLAPFASAATPVQPFEADFTVLRNGSEVGEARIRLSQDGPHAWRMHSTLSAAAAGGLLQFSSVEDSRFHWHDGRPRSDRYHARRQQPLRTRERGIDFDWDTGRVVATDRRGREQTFDVDGAAIDPQLTLIVAMIEVAGGATEFDYVLVNRGAPETQKGRRNGEDTVDTGIGKVACVEVERVRENSRRQTRSCHAESLDWIPIRVIQDEDGDVIEMRLKALRR